MAEPVVVTCPRGAWTKVLDNFTGEGNVRLLGEHQKKKVVYHTFRTHGNPAPTDAPNAGSSDAAYLQSQSAGIKFVAAVDVYMWPTEETVRVRLDIE